MGLTAPTVIEADHHYKARDELAVRSWDKSAHSYGSHVTIEEEIILIEVVSQKKYRTTVTVEVAECEFPPFLPRPLWDDRVIRGN